jgi:dienelactone hydrolase
VVIPVPGGEITGDLVVPDEVRGLVVFAHGSGSSRHSPRNRQVAETLQQAHLATLLVDLLTPREESQDDRDGRLRFDIPFLASRLQTVTPGRAGPSLAGLDLGYFGASTGGAAALVAAAEAPAVKAVVSRGGRPDLAGDALARVTAPTLLIVGGRDEQVLELNEQARRRMTAPVSLEVIPGATHLFEEPGALARVSELAWGSSPATSAWPRGCARRAWPSPGGVPPRTLRKPGPGPRHLAERIPRIDDGPGGHRGRPLRASSHRSLLPSCTISWSGQSQIEMSGDEELNAARIRPP